MVSIDLEEHLVLIEGNNSIAAQWERLPQLQKPQAQPKGAISDLALRNLGIP